MAWFSYKCPVHGPFRLTLEKRVPKQKCPSCGTESCAIIKMGTTQIIEKLDNGLMGRAVERLHNIEEIMNERADKHTAETEGSSEPEE